MCLKATGIAEELFLSTPISARKHADCVPPSPDISPLHFLFWNFLNEDIHADDFKKIKELKDAIVSELDHPHSHIVDKSLTGQGAIRLPAVTPSKGATGSFIINAAD